MLKFQTASTDIYWNCVVLDVGAMSYILLDSLSNWFLNVFSAHTKDSAKALVDTIQMAFPEARLALVVAMASDKDHIGFAREFLQGIAFPCKELSHIFLATQVSS